MRPYMLQLEGFEPTRFITIVLKTQEKASKPHDFKAFGGLEGDRTLDLRVANAALSQLSYEPIFHSPLPRRTSAGRTTTATLYQKKKICKGVTFISLQ